MTKAVERVRADSEALVTQAQQQDESDNAALGSRRKPASPKFGFAPRSSRNRANGTCPRTVATSSAVLPAETLAW